MLVSPCRAPTWRLSKSIQEILATFRSDNEYEIQYKVRHSNFEPATFPELSLIPFAHQEAWISFALKIAHSASR